MLNLLEFVSCRLGIRLSHLRWLIRRCSGAAAIFVAEDAGVLRNLVFTLGDVGAVEYVAKSLSVDFQQFIELAELIGLEEARGTKVLDKCLHLAAQCQATTADAETAACGSTVVDPFEEFEDFVRHSLGRAKAASWFLLGVHIAEFKLQFPRPDLMPWDSDPTKATQNRERVNEAVRRGTWDWATPDEVKRLAGEVGIDLATIFPPDGTPATRAYGEGGKYDPWDRLEQGLHLLQRAVEPKPGASGSSPHDHATGLTGQAAGADDRVAPIENEQQDGLPGAAEATTEIKWKPGRFGLKFDERNRVVRREGIDGEVDLSKSHLLWMLLREFESARTGYLSRDALRRVWGKCDLACHPQDGTVNDAVSELRKHVKRLGLSIESKRDLGWKLIEARVSPESPETGGGEPGTSERK